MKIFIGSYWVPFPSSEYGGSWVVIAKDKDECVEVLEQATSGWLGDRQYNDRIPQAVEEAEHYELAGEPKAHIVEMFTT
jgi:hypothetical protein